MEIPAIADPGQLIALANEITCQAAGRYRQAAEAARARGRSDLAQLFRYLADEETGQLERIGELTDRALAPLPAAWMNTIEPLLPALDLVELIHSRPYAAFAEAVREKDRAFRLYSFLAAQSDDQQVQGLAESIAKAQLQSAHRLRRSRRAAFHAERSQGSLWPKVREIGSLDDLQAAAEAAERRFLGLVEQRALPSRLETAIVQAMLAALPGLEPRRDEQDENAITQGALLDQALQAFAFYDAVAAQAGSPEVLAQAQALTAMALARIELLCGTP